MEPLAINAMVNLLTAAGNLSSKLQYDWYTVSAELEVFKVKVAVLSASHNNWVEVMRKYGLDDNDKLTELAKEALVHVEKEEKHVLKMEKSRGRRWKQRAFPNQLTITLKAVEECVNAGITLVDNKVKSSDVAERHLNYHPTPLPFGPDRKYVPIVQSIDEVKAAIEKEASGTHAIRVTTVYGEPGMGKTCLLKHLALHYDSAQKKQADGTESKIFPDGVFYLPCGKGKSHSKIRDLQRKLTQSLGSGSEPVSRVQTDGITEKLHGETLPDYDKLVRLKLKYQKVLIILDDVWEREVLQAVLIPGKAVTYLVSSQDSDIWDSAEKICMKSPTREEARKILAKYIDGLAAAENVELPGNITDIADSFIFELQFHPLTLAHVGLQISSDHANDPDEWINLRKIWHAELPEQGGVKPTVFDDPYTMALSETMNSMVDSLSESERSLLFLICLFEEKNTIPEAIVRRFHKHVKPQESPYDYKNCRKILQNKCLIEVLSYEGSRRSDPGGSSRQARKVDLVIHGTRARCIIQKNAEQLRSMAKQLFDPTTATNLSATNTSNFHGNRRTMIHSQGGAEGRASGWAQGVYTAVMGSMYLSKTFWDVVATNFQRLLGSVPLMMIRSTDSRDGNERSQQVLDNAVMGAMYLSKSFWPRGVAATKVHTLLRSVDVDVPPRMYANMDVSELMERAGDMKEQIQGLASLLNREGEGEGEWKEPAWYARKIILKFVCRQELDDESTARLIKFPHTTSVICDALGTILGKGYWSSTFVHQNKTFSNAHAETTKSLLTVLLDNQTTTDIRKSVLQVLEGAGGSIRFAPGSVVYLYQCLGPGVFDYECGDSIATIGKTLMNQLAKDVHHVTGNFDHILNPRKRASVWMYNLPEVWNGLMLQLRRSRSDNFVPLRAYDGQSYAQVVENLPTLSDSDCLNIIRHLLQWRFNHASMDDARFLDTFCNLAASIVERLHESVESCEYNQDQISCYGCALEVLEELSGIPENREQIWANELFQNNLGHILKWGTDPSGYDMLGVGRKAKGGSHLVVACPGGDLKVSDDDDYISIKKGQHHAISILGKLCLSERVRDSFASSFPTLDKKLRTLQCYIIACYGLLKTVRKEEYANLVREISKLRTILNPTRMYSQNETTYASPLSKYIFRGRFDAFHEMKMYEKANVYVDMKTEGGLPLVQIPTSLAVYVKAMSKDYKGAMAYPHILCVPWALVATTDGRIGRRVKTDMVDEKIFFMAENLGERGVLQRLSSENLIEARKDFDTSLNLLHSLSPEFLSHNLEKCTNLLYRLFQQRGFVKYKLKDGRGAREDAKAAQELECRSLVRKSRLSLCEPTSLLALPVTYLGFTSIRGGVFEVDDKEKFHLSLPPE